MMRRGLLICAVAALGCRGAPARTDARVEVRGEGKGGGHVMPRPAPVAVPAQAPGSGPPAVLEHVEPADVAGRFSVPGAPRVVMMPRKGVAERVEAAYCYDGAAPGDVAASLDPALLGGGWTGVSVEPHATVKSRWLVRGAADGLELTGFVDRGAFEGCDGAVGTYLSLGIHRPGQGAVGEEGRGVVAGPSGILAPRLPPTPTGTGGGE